MRDKSSTSSYRYDEEFFEYIELDSRRSSEIIVPLVYNWFRPMSVLDVGCGRGVWCRQWRAAGAGDVTGLDGPYVDPQNLLLPPEDFRGIDLSRPFDLQRRFDLVMSVEVAEHLPAVSADDFVGSLVRHGDVVLFSAATPGQGGENHINEQPFEYWRERFARHGYHLFDPVRPTIAGDYRIGPWFRYNILLYVAEDAIESLSSAVLATRCPEDEPVPDVASPSWRARNAILALLPVRARHELARAKHKIALTRRMVTRRV